MDKEHWELIAKKLSSELSSSEEKKLTAWLENDSSNQILLKETEHIWKLSGSIKSYFEPNTAKAWQKIKKQLADQERIIKLSGRRSVWLKITTSIAISILISFLVNYITSDAKVPMVEVVTNDSVKVFSLPDKTIITLNENSRFIYPKSFMDSLRTVTLIGEAFFEVASDPKKPFIIIAGKTQTRVIGTAFNIKAYEQDEDVKITVLKGKVQVKVGGENVQSVMLKTGDEVIYDKNNAFVKKQKSKDTDFMWWKRHTLKKDVEEFFKKIKKGI